MTKALVIGCGDPRLDAVFPKVTVIVQTDEAVPYRFPGADGLFSKRDRAAEQKEELQGIKNLLRTKGPFDAIAVLGHTDCAEHSVPIENHRRDTKLTAMQIRDRLETAPVHAILAIRGEADDDWILEDWGQF